MPEVCLHDVSKSRQGDKGEEPSKPTENWTLTILEDNNSLADAYAINLDLDLAWIILNYALISFVA